jgi:hypothetical protein
MIFLTLIFNNFFTNAFPNEPVPPVIKKTFPRKYFLFNVKFVFFH